MTKEEWAKAEKALEMFRNPVTFLIDGFKITVYLVRTSIYRNALAIYVNGKLDGTWFTEDCEERRRFLPQKERPIFSPSKWAEMKKGMRLTKKEYEKYNPNVTHYATHWGTFQAMKKHLIANNETIELVKCGFE